jgi:hypothetical protein
MNFSALLSATAEEELCVAAEVPPGSTYKSCFRSLIAIVTRLRGEARQPTEVNINWTYGDRAQKILSDLVWLGSCAAYPSPADLEFLVSTCVILPRSHYGEEIIKRAHDDATREVIRKLMADDDPAS